MVSTEQNVKPEQVQPQQPVDDDDDDLEFSEHELTRKNSLSKQPIKTEEEDFEEVDLEFTEQELTRKNSWDFVVDQKKTNDEYHDLVHGKQERPKVSVPAPVVSRGEVRRYAGESVEMTDFSCERDLEAQRPVEDKSSTSDCAVM